MGGGRGGGKQLTFEKFLHHYGLQPSDCSIELKILIYKKKQTFEVNFNLSRKFGVHFLNFSNIIFIYLSAKMFQISSNSVQMFFPQQQSINTFIYVSIIFFKKKRITSQQKITCGAKISAQNKSIRNYFILIHSDLDVAVEIK